jgi:hypothetical protein
VECKLNEVIDLLNTHEREIEELRKDYDRHIQNHHTSPIPLPEKPTPTDVRSGVVKTIGNFGITGQRALHLADEILAIVKGEK